jgi:transposase-like protein
MFTSEAEKAMEAALKQRGRVNIVIAGRIGVGKSTLINSIFQGRMADTGQGRPVTKETREITKEGIPGGVPAMLCSENSSGSLKALTHQSPELHSPAVMAIAVASLPIRCPACQNTEVIPHGITAQGTPRYRWKHSRCPYQPFLLASSHQGRLPEVKRQMLAMTLNGRGLRDLACVLPGSPPPPPLTPYKKAPPLPHVHARARQHLDPDERLMKIDTVEDVDVDARWSFVRQKTPPRWLWHAMAHRTGVG